MSNACLLTGASRPHLKGQSISWGTEQPVCSPLMLMVTNLRVKKMQRETTEEEGEKMSVCANERPSCTSGLRLCFSVSLSFTAALQGVQAEMVEIKKEHLFLHFWVQFMSFFFPSFKLTSADPSLCWAHIAQSKSSMNETLQIYPTIILYTVKD